MKKKIRLVQLRPVSAFFDVVSVLKVYIREMEREKQSVQKECVCRRTKAGRE